MLAIVTVVGSVLFIQGVEGINSFNAFLSVFSEEGESETVHESIIIEHVRFDPVGSKDVELWLRNTGLTTIGIDRITMVRIDTQELIINFDTAETIFGEEIIKITVTGDDVDIGACTEWDCSEEGDADLEDDEYRISITSGRGNSFETIATPFNT